MLQRETQRGEKQSADWPRRLDFLLHIKIGGPLPYPSLRAFPISSRILPDHLWPLHGPHFCSPKLDSIWDAPKTASRLILAHFCRTPSWCALFGVFYICRCHFWLTFGAERGSGIDFGGSENLIEKKAVEDI